MSPAGQSIGGKANSLQVPASKTFNLDPKIPMLDNVRLIKYDFKKYGKAPNAAVCWSDGQRRLRRCQIGLIGL